MPGKTNYCGCGAQRWKTRDGKKMMTPCYWYTQRASAPVGTGELGEIHPKCFLALGMRGVLKPQDQPTFDEEYGAILEKYAEKYPTVEAIMSAVPSLAATPWDVPFEPTNYAPNGLPGTYSVNIMKKILEVCQQVPGSTMTVVDPKAFTGSYQSLLVIVYTCESFPFIDEMRGLSKNDREEQNKTVKEHNKELALSKKPSHKARQVEKTRFKAKRRKISYEIAQIDANDFEVSDESFDEKKILNKDPNIDIDQYDKAKSDDAKIRFRTEAGIDENWTTREGVYERQQVQTIERQVRGGLISAEAILKLGRYYAMHFTLTNPLGPEWKKVNGFSGIVLSALLLKELAGMFPNRVLDPMDYCVWLSMAYQSGLNHVRVNNFGPMNQIPDKTTIYMGVTFPENVYYDKLAAFGMTKKKGNKKNYTLAENHAMSAILRQGGILIVDAWLSFEFHRNLRTPEFKVLPYTVPSISGKVTIT